MTDAPERIWAWNSESKTASWPKDGYPEISGYPGPCHWMGVNAAEYIRADIYEALEAEMQKVALYWGDRATDAEAENKRLREVLRDVHDDLIERAEAKQSSVVACGASVWRSICAAVEDKG